MTTTVTITLDVDKATARRLVEEAGFTVTRATSATPKTTVASSRSTTPPTPFTRASALTDMPTGLDGRERAAYLRGYANGCHRYVKRNGAPTIRLEGGQYDEATGFYRTTPPTEEQRSQLHWLTREHEWERHPIAHKAGLAELGRHQEKYPNPTRRAVA